MPQVALDLSPVVTSLLARPFDQPSLDRAYAAVGGHPQAYATALRCAAKKTPDTLAAAYYFAEAARVHESMNDLGGAIALLWRAFECDRGNPRPRELLAASMVRLSMRAGIGFTFSPGDGAPPAAEGPRPESTSVDTGLRPPAPERRFRDTMPELFGVDSADPAPASENEPISSGEEPLALVRRGPTGTLPSARAPEPEQVDAIVEETRVAQLLPPKNPSKPAPERRPRLAPAPASEPVLRAVAEVALPTRRNYSRPEPPRDDVYAEYGDKEAPPTLRPAGDHLVGGLFEALHELHFVEDVRQGAVFLGRTLAEKMHPATALVHLYDINSGHFIVVSAEGPRAAALVDYATPEDDAFIVDVMKSEDSTLVNEPSKDPRLARGRWLLVEPKRSVLCAPVSVDGRQLGLLEIVDPKDDGQFNEDDRNAIMYAASALSRFLERRGLVLSDEPERSSPDAAAAK